jgi:catechol 2,3-dioxygenase-like lactoylglutathione lyase family enzyme
MIELAKPAIDVGLFTNDKDGVLAFWQGKVGVPFSELLPVGGGVHQHRHAIGDSVLKINHTREALDNADESGIRKLTIAGNYSEAQELSDPDGNQVRLVPLGEMEQMRIDLCVSDLPAHRHFYGEVLGFPEVSENIFAGGATQLALSQGTSTRDPVQRARGYRYLTIQVFDVKSCHEKIISAGGREGRAPVKLGDVAHISFVRDPDGNWIEISQRKSITGSLD